MMPLSINREKLGAALKVASSLKSDTLPILCGRLLEVREGRLVVSATDLDCALEIGAGPVIEGEWGFGEALVLPGAELGRAVAALESESSPLGLFPMKGNGARLECGAAVVTVAGWDKGEFPAPPKGEERVLAGLSCAALRRDLGAMLFAVSTDDSRHSINGVCVEAYAESVRLIATDGRRLATLEDPVTTGTEAGDAVTIPTAAARLLMRLLEWQADVDESAEVTLAATDAGALVARAPQFTLWAKLIEGNFPNWRMVVPETREKGCGYQRIALELGAVKSRFAVATCVLSDLDSKAVLLQGLGDGVSWSASEPERGSAMDVLPLEYPEAKWGPVGLSAAFVKEALAHVPHDRFELCVKDATSPVVLECGTWRHVIMPLRVG
jgi:DNA polymerase-3 subunit beta